MATKTGKKPLFRDFADKQGSGLDNIIRSTKPEEQAPEIPSEKSSGKQPAKVEQKKLTKVERTNQFAMRVYPEQYSFLFEMHQQIQNSRQPSRENERITNNTIIRAFLPILEMLDVDLADIPDETELSRRFLAAVRKFS